VFDVYESILAFPISTTDISNVYTNLSVLVRYSIKMLHVCMNVAAVTGCCGGAC
jgi:hypothetical protein